MAHEPALSAWRSHMALSLASKYRDNLLRLSGFQLDYGFSDEFRHIPIGAEHLSHKLSELKVPHTLSAYAGGHGDKIHERLETVVLPFFSRTLQGP